MAVFDLTRMFSIIYGYDPGDFNAGELIILDKDVKKKSQDGKYGSYYEKDVMGRDVFMPITLGGLFLPYVWINISSSKRLVETPMTERRGNVNEFISMDSYKFGIKGLVIGHDGQFPEADVEDLKTLWERNEAVEIKSILTDIFLLSSENEGQDKVILTNFQLAENKGVEHVRGFTFDVSSDQEFDLFIK